MDDTDIIASLKENLKKILPQKDAHLTLFIKTDTGKEYTTSFTVKNISETIEEPSKIIISGNNCIQISYAIDTSIEANSEEKKCFDPILISNSSNTPNKITTTDILQVIKTKLLLALPYKFIRFGNKIYLADAAKKDGISLTHFKMLRGQPPLYQKYGYFDETYSQILTFLKKLKFSNIKDLNEPFYKFVNDKYIVKGDPPLTQVFQKISFHDAIKNKNEGFDEYEVFDNLISERMRNGEFEDYMPSQIFTFDETSKEWTEWKSRIIIDNFELIYNQEGKGRRHSKKNRQKQRRKLNSRKTKKN